MCDSSYLFTYLREVCVTAEKNSYVTAAETGGAHKIKGDSDVHAFFTGCTVVVVERRGKGIDARVLRFMGGQFIIPK